MSDPLNLVKHHSLVHSAILINTNRISTADWVLDSCSECSYHARSWSCPPGVGSPEQNLKTLYGYSEAIFLKFKSSEDKAALEKAVLDLESKLNPSYPKALGFFPHPCTACPECSYPKPCIKPESCRPTGESFCIDLLNTSTKAGLPVEIVKPGKDFKPVTLILLK